jgi:hypothetical protein
MEKDGRTSQTALKTKAAAPSSGIGRFRFGGESCYCRGAGCGAI